MRKWLVTTEVTMKTEAEVAIKGNFHSPDELAIEEEIKNKFINGHQLDILICDTEVEVKRVELLPKYLSDAHLRLLESGRELSWVKGLTKEEAEQACHSDDSAQIKQGGN